MKRLIGLVCVLVSVSVAGRLAAQDAAPVQTDDKAQIEAQIRAQESGQAPSQAAPLAIPQAAPEPTLKQNPLETLRKFEPGPDEEYQLGKGDEITVNFVGRPEMQAKLVVGPDGRVTLPLAGDIMVADLTRPEAAKAIESALTNYYTNLSVQVTVTKYTANRIVLLGAVDHPGMFTFDGTPTLLEVLARGGVEAGPNKSGTTPEVNQIPERCAIYRGSDQVVWVELRADDGVRQRNGRPAVAPGRRCLCTEQFRAVCFCFGRGTASRRHSPGLQFDAGQCSGAGRRRDRSCGQQSAHPDCGSVERAVRT